MSSPFSFGFILCIDHFSETLYFPEHKPVDREILETHWVARGAISLTFSCKCVDLMEFKFASTAGFQ